MSHFYLSYDQADGLEIAKSVSTTLGSGLPRFLTWAVDIHSRESEDKFTEASLAIQTSKVFILIQTPNTFNNNSRINGELKKAIGYKMPIIIIRESSDLDVLPRLSHRKSFTITDSNYKQELRNYLSQNDSFHQKLKTSEEYLKDAENDLLYNSNPENKKRIENEIESLKHLISNYKQLIGNFDSISKRTEERIELSIERERTPKSTKTKKPVYKIINHPPTIAPSYFQNRTLELELIKEFISQDSSRLAIITGRGGTGKTALACKLLKALEKGKWPNENTKVDISGIIYMNEVGSRPINFPNLYNDLSLLVEETKRKQLRELQNNSQSTVISKLNKLISYLPSKPIIVLLDNFEDKINPETRQIIDEELEEALLQLIELTTHSIKIIITTRISPQNILLHYPGRQTQIPLDSGLKSPHAENVLRKLDAYGHIGLKDADDQSLKNITIKTRGFPRALEAFYAILSADRTTTIDELTNSIHEDEGLTEILVGEAFNRLSDIDQKIMQALAVYGFPVLPSAIDFLLKSYIPNINSSVSLKRLVNMHFVRMDGKEFHLHPLDKEYALSRIQNDTHLVSNQNAITKNELYTIAAQYMGAISLPREEWTSLDDITPQIREFHLLIESQQLFDACQLLRVLSEFLGKKGGFGLMIEMAQEIITHEQDFESLQTAHEVMATGYWRIGNIEKSIKHHKENIKVLKKLNDDDDIFFAEANLIVATKNLNLPEENLKSFKQILYHIEKNYPWKKDFIATSHHYISGAYKSLGYFKKAIKHSLTALTIAEEFGTLDSIEAQHHNYASRVEDIDREKAIEFYTKALHLSKENGNPLWKSNHLSALSRCNSDMGDYTQAIALIEQSIEIRIKIGDIDGEASDIKRLATCLLRQAKFEDAKTKIEIALFKAQELKIPLNEYYALYAEVLIALGENEKALDCIQKALIENKGASFKKNNLAGVISLCLGKKNQATIFFNKALENADIYISRSSKNAAAFAAKGLAHAGLLKLDPKDDSNRKKAITAYQTSRELDAGAGNIERRQRLFQYLHIEDNPEVLLEAITGEPIHIDKNVNQPKTKIPTDSRTKPLKAFISYSKFDGENAKDGVNYLEEFKGFLAPLISYNKWIQPWDDTLLIPGEEWNEKIIEQLESSDVIFLLVSPHFLNTKYIQEVELDKAIKRHDKKECLVVPIFIKPSGFTDIKFLSKLNGIPRKGFTIAGYKRNEIKWPTKGDAWKHVYDQIKLMISSFSNRIE